jgi:hypothetical protein
LPIGEVTECYTNCFLKTSERINQVQKTRWNTVTKISHDIHSGMTVGWSCR